MNVHPSAIVDPAAQIDPSVEVGPYAIIEAGVRLAAGCKIAAHAQLLGNLTLGENCEVGPGAVLGDKPQDLSFDPSTNSGVVIGANNHFREHVTVHRGSKEGTFTRLGDGNFLMVGTHVGHNSEIGDNNIMANFCMVAGHVYVGNRCFFGGGAGFHQFCRIGDLCMIQGHGSINQDCPPYTLCAKYSEVWGLNVVGMRRAKFGPEVRKEIKRAFELMYRTGLNVTQALEKADQLEWGPEASRFFDFFRNPSRQGISGYKRG